MKILVLANNDIGLYKFRKELLERLINDGHRVYVSLPDGQFVSNLKGLGCEYINTEISRHGTNPFQDLKLLGIYKEILKNVKPDIVFTYTIKPNVYGGMACASQNIPYVMNITGLGTAVENGGILGLITLILYKCALRKVQTVFFQNSENEAFFSKRKLAPGKHKMLPGSGVNLTELSCIEYPVSNNIEFAFISRITKEKGIDQYLDAALYIKDKYPNTVFHVCGFCEQDYEQRLRELHEQGVIVYHGMVSDVCSVIGRVHCVVHPTYYPEGMSNVLLEASACGRPIITTNRSGCREVIDDGINGYVVEQKNSDDLIEKIESFLRLDYEQKREMGINGRKKVEKEFDRNIVIEKYMEELKGVKLALDSKREIILK